MKVVKNILGRIFALWALLAFAGTMLLFWIPIWATGIWPEPKRTHRVFLVFRLWMTTFFILSGVRRIITGKQHLKKGETYVATFNHRSFMDVPLSTTGIPGDNKTIAKMELSKIPIFGMVYKRGSVLVNRKSEESRRSSYNRMKEVLAMGLHMCIYPEGTRNRTGEPLGKFHDGAFRLAVETGRPVLPAIILNTDKVLPTNRTFFFWPQPVEMHFFPAIPSVGKTAEVLKEEVYQLMKTEIEKRERRQA